jgi:hypothetical protein
MRTKRFTVSIAFFLLSIFLVKGVAGFSMSCFSALITNTDYPASQNANSDDAEKIPEEKSFLAEEYTQLFEQVLINHPEGFDRGKHKAVRNTFIPQAVYLSIPVPPPNGRFV